jgi:hypothetical protein
VSVSDMPTRGAVLWPVGTGDSTTIVIDDDVVLQVDLHDMAKADDDNNPEVPVVDELVEALPRTPDGDPYLAVFALTHADQDHCSGFADLLEQVRIGELWATPRLWREYDDDPTGPGLCEDAIAFRDECVRRVAATMTAMAAGQEPASGDRILVIGYDTDHSAHAYDELPETYKSGPGKSVTDLDGHDCGGKVEVFFHAPFADDCAAARNDTSLAMQITLIGEFGVDGKLLLMGDLAHETIMKIFDYSEDHQREQYLQWDLLLAPHHCSKKVMFVTGSTGKEIRQDDVLDALERHARPRAVIVSSSVVIPATDAAGANPPHRKAANCYNEIVDDEVICTMSWGNETAPTPVIFTVDEYVAEVTPAATLGTQATRLAAVTNAAVRVARQLPTTIIAQPSGPERIRAAIESDRGGHSAPSGPVGFGR